ncbi:uncharacterized protein LOC106767861 isoform X1 [Vigna radiata var. radiata]|uniref:Uncharacterized protein LOC106767861 isoform X1 n=1 Tax=Vigna radiata var. radiata TaxID=3916 RepID=A0A1S3UQP1_VIGRR|nr:uncharacterized protein LOC106767861 isoform X1 [Vigna radiata var. radiata]
MESAISLRYCPFPYSSKGFQSAASIGFHLRLNHATPLSAPQFSATRHQVTRSVWHANCTFERFSQPTQKEERGSEILRGVTGASLVLACVLGLFNFKMNPKLTTAHASSSSSFPSSGHYNSSMFENEVDGKGRDALESLLKIMKDAQVHENEIIPSQFNEDRGPSGEEVNTLKCIAIRESKSPKGREALKKLQEQYIKCKNDDLRQAQEYLGVALVEVLLLLQENLEEARKILDHQIIYLLQTESKNISAKKANKLTPKEKCDELLNLYDDDDSGFGRRMVKAKLILYKAIVHTMLEDNGARKWGNKEALEWRKTFIKTF